MIRDDFRQRAPALPRRVAAYAVMAAATLAFAAPAAAEEAPTAVVAPLAMDKAGAAFRAQLEAGLRTAAARHATVKSSPEGAEPCGSAKCARDIGKQANVRFVIFGDLEGADEIYRYTLRVFDVAHDHESIDKSGSCELCAVAEVQAEMGKTVDKLKPAFERKPPVQEPLLPARMTVKVATEPAGAPVFVDGKRAGETPLSTDLYAGEYEVKVALDGYLPQTRKITVGEVPVELALTLEKDPDASPPPVADKATDPEPEPERTGGRISDTWGWISIGVGVAAMAAGSWLVHLDGEVTCDDGRGRFSCPEVYETKAPGASLIGVGAAGIGAGIIILAD